MADTVRSTDDLLNASTGLFRDNTSGDISAQDLRDFVLSTYRPQGFCTGRLTLTSGTPVTTSDVTTSTNVYFTPYNGNLVGLYDGTSWKLFTFTELTLAIGTVVPFQAYDVFLYDNSGTLTLEQLEWQNATVTMTSATPCVVTWTGHGLATGNSVTFTTTGGLYTGVSANTQYWVTVVDANTFKLSTSLINVGTGTFVNTSGSQSGTHTAHSPTARATALTTQDGVYVKSGATTRRYLGTFLAVSTTQTCDTYGGSHNAGGQRFLWNLYNQVPRPMAVIDTTDSWTYTSAAYRQARATAGNKVEYVQGLSLNPVSATAVHTASYSGGGSNQDTGVGVDSTTTNSAKIGGGSTPAAGVTNTFIRWYSGSPGIGYHSLVWLEYSGPTTGTTTWYGDIALSYRQDGLFAEVWG